MFHQVGPSVPLVATPSHELAMSSPDDDRPGGAGGGSSTKHKNTTNISVSGIFNNGGGAFPLDTGLDVCLGGGDSSHPLASTAPLIDPLPVFGSAPSSPAPTPGRCAKDARSSPRACPVSCTRSCPRPHIGLPRPSPQVQKQKQNPDSPLEEERQQPPQQQQVRHCQQHQPQQQRKMQQKQHQEGHLLANMICNVRKGSDFMSAGGLGLVGSMGGRLSPLGSEPDDEEPPGDIRSQLKRKADGAEEEDLGSDAGAYPSEPMPLWKVGLELPFPLPSPLNLSHLPTQALRCSICLTSYHICVVRHIRRICTRWRRACSISTWQKCTPPPAPLGILCLRATDA